MFSVVCEIDDMFKKNLSQCAYVFGVFGWLYSVITIGLR